MAEMDTPAMELSNFTFRYPPLRRGQNASASAPPPEVLKNVNLRIERGSRVLLLGGNGAGKSTLCSVLGGKRMLPLRNVKVLGRDAFDDMTLQQDVMYLGEWWKNDFSMNVSVGEMMRSNLEDERFQKLKDILGVSLDWVVSAISDGQRRRCQLLVHLTPRRSVYILDEVTTELDVIARDSLLRLLREESERRRATILYATHILDSIEGWPTHLLYLRAGEIHTYETIGSLEPYQSLLHSKCVTPLYSLLKGWLYEELNTKALQNSSDEKTP